MLFWGGVGDRVGAMQTFLWRPHLSPPAMLLVFNCVCSATFCMLSWGGVRWLRSCMLPDWSHATLLCMFFSFILWCFNCHCFFSLWVTSVADVHFVWSSTVFVAPVSSKGCAKQSSFGKFQNHHFHSWNVKIDVPPQRQTLFWELRMRFIPRAPSS